MDNFKEQFPAHEAPEVEEPIEWCVEQDLALGRRCFPVVIDGEKFKATISDWTSTPNGIYLSGVKLEYR